MSNTTIKIKRSFANTSPNSLLEGELAYSYASNSLFIGSQNNTPITIASANVISRVSALEANSGTSVAAYDQANAAYALADTAIIDAFYANALAVSVSSQVGTAANTVRVSHNGTDTLDQKQLNFVDSSSATVSVTNTLDGNVNIGVDVKSNLSVESLTAANSIDFIPKSSQPYVEGRLYYSSEEKTWIGMSDYSDFEQTLGEREWVRCRNSTANTILKGKAVYVTGTHIPGHPIHGHHPTIDLADASDENKKDVIGLAGTDIPPGQHGFVVVRGYIEKINTSNLIEGSRVHLGYDGNIQGYAPEYPNWPMDLGVCLTSDSSNGTLYVTITDHSFERMRVLYDAYIGGSVVVEGDLTVYGNQNFVSASDFYVGGQFLYLDGGDTIGFIGTTFYGTGLNDMVFRGSYDGDAASTDYYVRIASAGVPGISYDTFDWSYNSSFSPLEGSNIPITGIKQTLSNGISIEFISLLGHTVDDQWYGTAFATNRDFGIIGHYNDGTYNQAGLFRDSVDGDFKFFTRYVPEPSGNIDASNATFQLGNVLVDKISANSFYRNGIDLYNTITAAANTSSVYANGTLSVSNSAINFVNSSTIRATVTSGSGLANVSFDLIGSSGIASFPVSGNSVSTVSANGLNFVNSATVGVTVSQGISGNANISFTTLAGGGTITSVATGVGLTGGPITTSGTISANIASTTVQGVTKLIDSVTSTDSANAATASSVKAAFDQATSAYGQANTANSTAISAYGQANAAFTQANAAFTQANTANTIAIAAYGQANLSFTQANAAYAQANSANSIAIAAYGQANAAYSQANSANSIAIDAYGQANAAYTQANTANSIAISAYGQANGAFSQANLGFEQANTARDQANLSFTQANLAYAQANTARDLANTANNNAISAYGQANAASLTANSALAAANVGSNTVRVSANSGSVFSNVSLNFVNTATVQVSVTSGETGVANIAFTSTATGGGGSGTLNNFPVSVNTESTVVANGINFINSASVTVSVTQGIGGNANISFTAITSGTGTVTSVDTGTGLSGGPITSSGTISANIASTTVVGVTKLVDSVTSTDAANAATSASVKTAYDQATLGYGQANAAFTHANTANTTAVFAYNQANTAYSQANVAFTQANTARDQANAAFTQANTANTTAVAAYGQANAAFDAANTGLNRAQVSANSGSIQSNVAINFVNTSSVQVSVGAGSSGNANVAFSAVAGSTTTAGILQLTDSVTSTSTTTAATANAVKTTYDFAATKYSSSGGTISGDVTINGNLILTGGTSQLNVTNLSVNDTIILLGSNNISDVLDIGFVGHYRTGGGVNSHAGIIRHASDKLFYVFENYEVEPTNNVIDVTGNNFRLGNVRLGTMNANSVLILGTPAATTTEVGVAYGQANAAYDQANTARSQANAAYGQANTARDTGNSAYAQANAAYGEANTARDTANSAYTQANTARDQANTAHTQANTARDQANNAFTTANVAINRTQVSANSGSVQSNVAINFNNTASVTVSVGSGTTGNANVTFSAVAGSTTTAGILQLTDSVTSTSTTTAATPNSVKTAYDQATLGYGQANAASTQANAARDQANTAYTQANAAYTTANNSANATRVSANSGPAFSNVSLNFVNTATVQVSVTSGATGVANIAFTSTSGGTGTVTQIDTGLGLTGGPITSSGTVSANIANTTVQGITKLIDSVTTNDAANAATAASVKTAYDQATTAYGQANAAIAQANTARDQANAAFAAANNAANTVTVSANGGSTLSSKQLNFVNTATVTVVVTDKGDGNANIAFTSVGGTATPGGSNTQVQFNNNGTLGASANFTYNTAPNLVSLDANLKLAGSSNLYFGGEQANNSVANSKFRVSYNASAMSLDFTFLG